MKFLLTNDDGIDAEGLAALADAAAPLGSAVWVAPDSHHSGCGHRVTTDRAIGLSRRSETRWAIDGTPADCVRVALAHLAQDVDWVLSGLNHGGNLGADVFHSGTVAAVREAALHGKPGIALSHYRRRAVDVDWTRAAAWARQALKMLLARPWEPGTFWNVNLPHPGLDEPEPRIVFCPLEAGPLPLSFRADGDALHYAGNYHERRRQPGSDVDVCFAGNIAVTRVAVYG
jgi:5'-nucleotidase